ncbi:TetR family transcriptional regulator [Catellatospora sp. TT07R-123]|uniref:TetR/AcrR family transcriptional regulator n=1 Tax=Catellatospora sp. TT07R-123 TaxID=2733863 RepID=UPI001B09805B|nr:TetR/AcrR family transcriptional regulator [Catellatospora sp. TT07R-123]GHJ44229.1 TetR family transcriptional regulator [Catellatospora sp. TT07R-123]
MTPALGRPREYDTDEVLDRAMKVFWAKGYEGTSMADLTAASGLKPGSIYSAFGSKAGLFERVLDRYVDTVFGYAAAAVRAPTVREVVRRWLDGVVHATTGSTTPPGCLLVQGALAVGDTARAVQEQLHRRRLAGERMLVERLERARSEGDLPAGADPAAIAGWLLSLSAGMSVEAAGGADRRRLQRTADLALARLPWE